MFSLFTIVVTFVDSFLAYGHLLTPLENTSIAIAMRFFHSIQVLGFLEYLSIFLKIFEILYK
jgi:hypothetical protein